MERRHFLLDSAALAAGSRVFGIPNDTVRIGLTGIGGRGRNHIMTCIGDSVANELLTRDYRVPYVIPEEV